MKNILFKIGRYTTIAMFSLLVSALMSNTIFKEKQIKTTDETKKFFIVLETDSYYTHAFINGKDDWKQEVPYKNYVRIIVAPFEAPSTLTSENGYNAPIRNQLADFIVGKHLTVFEKMKLHNRAFQFSIREYSETAYTTAISDCKDCRYQHEKYILENFKFNPVISNMNVPNESTKKLNLIVSGKEWGKY